MDRLFNPTGQLTIEEVHAWMDGGSVTLLMMDKESKIFEIEFVQKAYLEKRDNLPYPGSLLLDKKEIGIRSALESKIISAINGADWGTKIIENEKGHLRQMINDCVDFIMSDKYIQVSKQVGRIN